MTGKAIFFLRADGWLAAACFGSYADSFLALAGAVWFVEFVIDAIRAMKDDI